MSGPDIFISYSREERQAARHFAECFAQEGFAVWWDAALRSGETFDEVIERELRASRAVVVLWSPRSVASRWVRAEATLADRANKLVPVIIESCSLPIIFELTQAADLANWTGDTADTRWQTLVSDLRRLVEPHKDDAHASPAPQPVAKAPPQSPLVRNPPASPRPEVKPDELIAALDRVGKPRD
ncbi:toll/interleukin-1 receptor domain-containing protein, partial [Sphingomonas sp.]|uniref:toll/interleukin-1 receptor domain-containing protein n=1 Tax=Sphingomonas sp. TaxID=28214 RepID=UPI0025CF7B9E